MTPWARENNNGGEEAIFSGIFGLENAKIRPDEKAGWSETE